MPISTLLITLVTCGPKSNETTNVSTISEEQKQEEQKQVEQKTRNIQCGTRWFASPSSLG